MIFRQAVRGRFAAAFFLCALTYGEPAVAQSKGAAQVSQGASLYQTHCVVCHGPTGRGGQGFPRPVWGPGHDLKKFTNASGLYEYIQLTMPFDNPQKMTDAQKLAVVAFLLERNTTIDAETELTAANAPKIKISP